MARLGWARPQPPDTTPGDVDADGLRIPAAASVVAVQAGLPPVRPASALYEMLLARGTRQAQDPMERDRASEVTSWLDASHQDTAVALLAGGGRYAQEACRLSLLAADAAWQDGLDGT